MKRSRRCFRCRRFCWRREGCGRIENGSRMTVLRVWTLTVRDGKLTTVGKRAMTTSRPVVRQSPRISSQTARFSRETSRFCSTSGKRAGEVLALADYTRTHTLNKCANKETWENVSGGVPSWIVTKSFGRDDMCWHRLLEHMVADALLSARFFERRVARVERSEPPATG